MMPRTALWLLIPAALVIGRTIAFAHDPGNSTSDLAFFEREVSYYASINAADLPFDRAGKDDAAVFYEIMGRVEVTANGALCDRQMRALEASDDGYEIDALFTCPKLPTQLAVNVGWLADVDTTHRHFVTIRRTDGEVEQRVLNVDERTFEVAEQPAGVTSTTADFVVMGIEHILIGYDHIFFLLGLVIVARSFKKLAGLVTAFTIGHTVTLIFATLVRNPLSAAVAVEIAIALATAAILFEYGPWAKQKLGVRLGASAGAGAAAFAAFAAVGHLDDPIAWVEALIAVSVVFVGVENFFFKEERRRWVLAVSFGLVHGFGFASVLSELHLPSLNRVVSLGAFNIGVEIGQLGIVSIAFPLVLWAARSPTRMRRVTVGASAVVALGGLYFLSMNLLS